LGDLYVSPNYQLVIDMTASSAIIVGLLAAVLVVIVAGSFTIAAHKEILAFAFAIWSRPVVGRLRSRYQREINFLVRRFSPEGAFGLSFTLGLAALVASTLLFGDILDDVLDRDEVARFDAPIVRFIVENRVAWLTLAMKSISQLGQTGVVAVVMMAAGFYFHRHTGRWRPLLLLSAAGGALVLDLAAKIAIGLPRPPAAWMVVPAYGYGFPSGHTTLSAVYITLAHFMARLEHRWRRKVFIYATGVTIAFLIGVSRVYLGVHWPTDVIGGWALAAAWMGILLMTTSAIEASRSGNKQR
jgi:membrane-associated phospholipid phosphatase